MTMLSKEQVRQIHNAVRRNQIPSFGLESEVTDFIACAVEEKMARGQSFDTALQEAISETGAIDKLKAYHSPSGINQINVPGMLRNYLVVAMRNLRKHRFYTAISLTGLSFSMVALLIIGAFVKSEYTYDREFSDHEQLFRVNSFNRENPARHDHESSPFLADALLDEVPQIEQVSGLKRLFSDEIVNWNGKKLTGFSLATVRESFLDMFGIRLLSGSADGFDDAINELLISDGLSARLFGKASPIGETVELIEGENVYLFKVSGVFEALPEGTHLSNEDFRFDMLTSVKTRDRYDDTNGWQSTKEATYVKLLPGTDVEPLDARINEVLRARAGEDIWYQHYLQPVNDIYLNRAGIPIATEGNLTRLYVFSLVGLLILLIACINYINLMTAQASVRLKELGVRKVIGASRAQFVFQFLTETLLLSFLAAVVALSFTYLLLPLVNDYAGLNLDFLLRQDLFLVFSSLCIVSLMSIVCGTYPGVYLSRLSSSNLLRQKVSDRSKKWSFRKPLVSLQYAISIGLVMATLVILRQIRYMNEKDLGFDKEAVVYLDMGLEPALKYGRTLLAETESKPGIIAGSLTGNTLGADRMSGSRIEMRKGLLEGDNYSHVLPVGPGFREVMKLKMKNGDWFTEVTQSDSLVSYIVNEAFVRENGLGDPIGEKLWRNGKEGRVIGIVNDFHFKSMRHAVDPLVLYVPPATSLAHETLALRLVPANITTTIDQLTEVWDKVIPYQPFEIQFLDDQIRQFYEKERSFAQVFSAFSFLAITISCLGLIGLVSFTTRQRSKEIGVRKVLGASIKSILTLISKEFAMFIFYGAVIAWPVTHWLVGKWLQDFDNRIELNVTPFLISLLVSMVLSWISVSYISFRAAKANPVDALRSE